MKQLHLIRHAKSSWEHPELSDHQRPLNGRGRQPRPSLAVLCRRRLRLAGARHRSFLSAPQRARETFDGLTIGWPLLGEQVPNYDDALYTFDEADLIDWIAAANDGLDSIALIGHNPAMTELANFLCPTLALSTSRQRGGFGSLLMTTHGTRPCNRPEGVVATICTHQSQGNCCERMARESYG